MTCPLPSRRCLPLRCLMFLTLFVVGCSSHASPQPVWLGHVAPLSGAAAQPSEETVWAMQLAVEEGRDANGAPVVAGVRHVDVADSARAQAEVIRLLAVNRVAALIAGPGLASPEAVLLAGRAHGAAVVLTDEVPFAAASPGDRLLGPNPLQRGRTLARVAHSRWKRTKAILLIDRDDRIATTVAEAFADEWRKQGGSLAEGRTAAVAATAAEVFVVAATGNRARNYLDELAARAAADAVFLYAGADDGKLTPKPAWRQAVYQVSIHAAQAALSPAAQAWRTRYQQRFGAPPGRAALLAHDAVTLLFATLADATRPDRADLVKQMSEQTTFDSLTGRLTWSNGRPQRTLYLLRDHGGKQELIETIPVPEVAR